MYTETQAKKIGTVWLIVYSIRDPVIDWGTVQGAATESDDSWDWLHLLLTFHSKKEYI